MRSRLGNHMSSIANRNVWDKSEALQKKLCTPSGHSRFKNSQLDASLLFNSAYKNGCNASISISQKPFVPTLEKQVTLNSVLPRTKSMRQELTLLKSRIDKTLKASDQKLVYEYWYKFERAVDGLLEADDCWKHGYDNLKKINRQVKRLIGKYPHVMGYNLSKLSFKIMT